MEAILFILASYSVGCVNAGYYVVRLRKREDIRKFGSGNAGSRNAGRMLGRSGFLLTLFLDLAKGGIIVFTAVQFGLGLSVTIAASIAVVAGHIWPLQLRFHGGKGIAAALGAILVLDYKIVVILILLFLGLFLFYRNFTVSGLAAFFLTPFLMICLDFHGQVIAALFVIDSLLFIAHRDNIRDEWASAKKEHSTAWKTR